MFGLKPGICTSTRLSREKNVSRTEEVSFSFYGLNILNFARLRHRLALVSHQVFQPSLCIYALHTCIWPSMCQTAYIDTWVGHKCSYFIHFVYRFSMYHFSINRAAVFCLKSCSNCSFFLHFIPHIIVLKLLKQKTVAHWKLHWQVLWMPSRRAKCWPQMQGRTVC